MKYNVTNISAESDKGAHNIFLTEAGKLLKAGDSITCNRIDTGTWGLQKAGYLKIELGEFAQAPIFKDALPATPEDESPTGPRPEDVQARREAASAMDQRIAEAAAAGDAAGTASATDPAIPAPASSAKKSNGKS